MTRFVASPSFGGSLWLNTTPSINMSSNKQWPSKYGLILFRYKNLALLGEVRPGTVPRGRRRIVVKVRHCCGNKGTICLLCVQRRHCERGRGACARRRTPELPPAGRRRVAPVWTQQFKNTPDHKLIGKWLRAVHECLTKIVQRISDILSNIYMAGTSFSGCYLVYW